MSQVTVRLPGNGMKNLPRGNHGNGKKTLEDFAMMIEARLKQGYGPDAVANYICRLLTHKDPKIAGAMWCKWVEWRYGKAKAHLEHSGPDGGPVHIQILSHVPRPGDRPGDDPVARDDDARDGEAPRTATLPN